jgi:hypothetical protein
MSHFQTVVLFAWLLCRIHRTHGGCIFYLICVGEPYSDALRLFEIPPHWLGIIAIVG